MTILYGISQRVLCSTYISTCVYVLGVGVCVSLHACLASFVCVLTHQGGAAAICDIFCGQKVYQAVKFIIAWMLSRETVLSLIELRLSEFKCLKMAV